MNRTYDTNTIYKDSLNKKLTGVCAGIARHYDMERWLVRGLTLGALFLMPMVTGVAYVVASVLLRNR
ncbi:MAG: PspC domain-containing protein [Psychrosphaera sp.]|nr:PspC domain-containing protein [Psychrosphaera sp.]